MPIIYKDDAEEWSLGCPVPTCGCSTYCAARRMVEAEREACAKVAEAWGRRPYITTDLEHIPGAASGALYASAGIADAIRARL